MDIQFFANKTKLISTVVDRLAVALCWIRRGRFADVNSRFAGRLGYIPGVRILIGAAIDATAHRESTRRLQEREQYFRALTENVADVIAILDGDGVISYVSPSAERVLGRHVEELLGTVAFACIHPDDQRRFSEHLAALAAGRSIEPVEYRIQHANKTWRVMELVGTNLIHQNDIQGLVVRLRDVTDRRRMEQEVEQLRRLTSLGRLAAEVAHEFNNVLMGIQPMVDVIRRRNPEHPELLQQLEPIMASIARGKRITTGILRFGRPAQPALKLVSVDDILRNAADEIRPMVSPGTNVEVTSSEVSLVHADPAQLSQVLVNLALNAADAMPEGGTLTMRASLARDNQTDADRPVVEFKVSDTGRGIADEDLQYVFEPLFTTKRTGTGLGLSVVYQIVTAHHGHISVESEAGRGATFTFTIPAVTEERCDDEELIATQRFS